MRQTGAGTAMRTWIGLALFVVGASISAQSPHMAGEVLVKYQPGSELSRMAYASSMGFRSVRPLPGLGIEKIQLGSGQRMEAVMADLRARPFVVAVEPNYVLRTAFSPNDPLHANQWALEKMSAYPGWDLGQGSSSIKIAIIDTGVDLDHPDLSAKIVPGFDFVNNDSVADDDHGHGTHCAGIAAASTNNGVGVAGIGFSCSIMPIKVLSASGAGSTSNVANGIIWAVDNGAKVVSLSLGGGAPSFTLESAVDYAWNNGVVVVAAAGNDGSTAMMYPGAYTNAIAVGSTNSDDSRSSFSNYGPWVDVAAPGSGILNTTMGGSYGYMSGTSMATPHVAGLAGLLWDKLGTSTNVSMIRNKIETTSNNIGSWVAFGRVNVADALDSGSPPPPPPPAPVVEFAPSQVALLRGSGAGGSLEDVGASDDARMIVQAVRSGRSFITEHLYSFQTTGTPSRLGFRFEASSSVAGSSSLYLYNFQRRRWQSLSSVTLSTSDIAWSRDVTSGFAPFVSPSGEVRVRFLASRRSDFQFRLDRFTVRTAP